MTPPRQKKRQSTRTKREKMLRYLNRFKLKKKQIKYKPRTYANLQGINSLRSQNAVNIEAPKPIIRESVKARLDCNLNALLQLDNEKKINDNIRRIKPQESYINMEMNVARKKPKQNPHQKEADLESEQDQLSKNDHSEFAFEPLNSDYRSDFETCFDILNESSLNEQNNNRKKPSLPNHLRKQRKNNNDFSPLLIHGEASNPAIPKVTKSSNCREIEFTNSSFYEHVQSERVKEKELTQTDDTFNTKHKYSQNEWETSTPSKSLDQCSKSRFVFPDSPSKFPSFTHSDGRFNRNYNRKVIKDTRASSMPHKEFYDTSFNKTLLPSKTFSPDTKQQNDQIFDSSFQTEPFERKRYKKFANPPSTIYSSVGSEYRESLDTIRNGVKAGHGNEPPTLAGIPDNVFLDRPIHYERYPSESLLSFSSSNIFSALANFVQGKCNQSDRPSILSAIFTRTVIRGQNTYREMIRQEIKKSR